MPFNFPRLYGRKGNRSGNENAVQSLSPSSPWSTPSQNRNREKVCRLIPMQLYCYRLFMKCLFCFFNEIFNVKVSFFCLLAATFFFGAHRGSRENIPKVTFCKFSRVSHRVSPPPSLATAQNYSHTRRQWHVKLLFFLLHGKQFYPRIKSTHKKKVFSASWEGKKN